MSEFKSPKDCREPEYQEFALSRWKNLSDEEKKICIENKKVYVNDNLLQIPESAKENLYRRMWGMPLVEGEEWGSSDLRDHIERVGISGLELASLLRSKDWEEVTERRDDYTLYTIYEFCDVTEREMKEFIGDDYITVNAQGDIIYKWLEDDDFVYVPSNVWSFAGVILGDETKSQTLRRFKKSMVSSILSTYRIEGEE